MLSLSGPLKTNNMKTCVVLLNFCVYDSVNIIGGTARFGKPLD